MTQPQVPTLRAGASSAYRRAWIGEQLRDRFWVVPAAFLILGAC